MSASIIIFCKNALRHLTIATISGKFSCRKFNSTLLLVCCIPDGDTQRYGNSGHDNLLQKSNYNPGLFAGTPGYRENTIELK
jgi:hypothetical protein